MSDEIDLRPAFGRDLEDAVENATPAFGRDHVTCTSLTIDRGLTVRGAMEIEYKGEIDNPAHNPFGVDIFGNPAGVGPPTYAATWTIRYWWQSYYANTLPSDIQVQAAGELPVVGFNTPFVAQRIVDWMNGRSQSIHDYVYAGPPPQGVQGGKVGLPPASAYKDHAVVRFMNRTPHPLVVELLWNPQSASSGQPFGPGEIKVWSRLADQHFWDAFRISLPLYRINSGPAGVVPVTQISKVYYTPTWATPSTITGKVECNSIALNHDGSYHVFPDNIDIPHVNIPQIDLPHFL